MIERKLIRPDTLAEALAQRERYEQDGLHIAGGQSILVLLRNKLDRSGAAWRVARPAAANEWDVDRSDDNDPQSGVGTRGASGDPNLNSGGIQGGFHRD